MSTRKFQELIQALPQDRRVKLEQNFAAAIAEMPLDQLRKALQMTQVNVANALDVSQGEVSKIEHRGDICVSTLAEYIEAIGGRLEIRAVFPDREVRVTQFESRSD